MDARTRVCVWIIALGLANFVVYTVGWALIGGESMNGYVVGVDDGADAPQYWMRRGGVAPFPVTRREWIYSAVHSISMPLTVGAVVLSMLTLAKDRLIASMHSTIVRGRMFITVLAAGIGVLTVGLAAYFTWYTVTQLARTGRSVAVAVGMA